VKLDEKQVEELREWAREKGPIVPVLKESWTERRPVRLEIAAERDCYVPDCDLENCNPITARVYLREPRCKPPMCKFMSCPCECGPIAERRLA
jgi:hypothetical protein